MLPSKDDAVLHDDRSFHDSRAEERDERQQLDHEESLSWKKLAVLDLTPSRHRDT